MPAAHVDEAMSPLGALARHAGSADIVDALLRAAPDVFGVPALVATLRPGVAHNAQRLLTLPRDPAKPSNGGGSSSSSSARCLLDDTALGAAWRELSATPARSHKGQCHRSSAWHDLAFHASTTSAACVDAILARVEAARATVYELLSAALLSADQQLTLALRLATKHWHGAIDVAPLLAAPRERSPTAGMRWRWARRRQPREAAKGGRRAG